MLQSEQTLIGFVLFELSVPIGDDGCSLCSSKLCDDEKLTGAVLSIAAAAVVVVLVIV